MTIIGAYASLYLKKASGTTKIIEMATNNNLYIGAMLYLASAVLNIWILKYLDYSVVLPLTSLTYIWTMILSAWKLKEKISCKKKIGIIVIIIGAIMVSI